MTGAVTSSLSLLGAFTVLVAAQVVRAETIRVPDDYAGVASALSAAVDGDSVLIDPGSYPVAGGLLAGGVFLGSWSGDPGSVELVGVHSAGSILIVEPSAPLAVTNSPDGCGLVGAYGLGGCKSVSLEPNSWARIKARYR